MAGTPKMWTAINQSVGDGSPQRIETRTRAYEDEMLGYATDPNYAAKLIAVAQSLKSGDVPPLTSGRAA